MKVILVNHFPLRGSGSGVYVNNLACNLVKKGHDVIVISPEHDKIRDTKFETNPIIFHNGENVLCHFEHNFPCFTTHPKSSVTFYDLTNDQINYYLNVFKIKLIDVFRHETDPKIVHTQHLWISSYVASKIGVPYVATTHGTELIGLIKDKRYTKYAKQGAVNAKKIISLTYPMKEKIVEIFGIDPKNIEVIPGGVDTSLFRPFRVAQETVLSKYGIEKRGKIVLFVGKLTKVKGVEYLLKAAKIYEKSNGIITLISGYGEQFDELTHLSNKLGLKNIYFLGHQRQEDLVYLYNIAEVTIIPSIFEYFGLVAIESLATGTPVIGTRVGGLPYILKNNTGYIVEPKDYKDLADKILKIMDVEFKKSRSNQISNYAKKNFSWDVIVKKTEKVYNEALGV